MSSDYLHNAGMPGGSVHVGRYSACVNISRDSKSFEADWESQSRCIDTSSDTAYRLFRILSTVKDLYEWSVVSRTAIALVLKANTLCRRMSQIQRTNVCRRDRIDDAIGLLAASHVPK